MTKQEEKHNYLSSLHVIIIVERLIDTLLSVFIYYCILQLSYSGELITSLLPACVAADQTRRTHYLECWKQDLGTYRDFPKA